MESKKISQLATELTPSLSDLTIIGDPTTGISKKITLSQMASLFTGTVEEYANLAAFPLVGVADTIYIALDTNILYRWNTGTSAYVELSPNIVSSLVFNDANGFDGTINLVGSVATLTITTALTTGSVGFIGASGALLQDNANFFWDDTNNRLGLGTNAPTTALDVFGSGIIARLNGTSTNNSFLGFASAGTNKWSIGNVQSDHRFRIYNEATTNELFTVLQTGEVGIGVANPLTKVHIDGGATALIANLDANVSVAKSISFRSDNSNRINLEVSGTESGSNAGADLFIRRYSDAGALIDTPFTITRSTGAISLATALSGTSATFSGTGVDVFSTSGIGTSAVSGLFRVVTAGTGSGIAIGQSNSTRYTSILANEHIIYNDDFFMRTNGAFPLALGTNNTARLTISSTGAATFTSTISAGVITGDSNSTGVPSIIAKVGSGGNSGTYGFGGNTDYKIRGGSDYAAMIFDTAGSERLRIQSDGTILAGTTNDGFFNGSVQGVGLYGSNGFIAASRNGSIPGFFNRYSSTGELIQFRYAGSAVGNISTNGSTTAYNTSPSDLRLKINIEDWNQNIIEAFKNANPKIFHFNFQKNTDEKTKGFIAQDLYQYFPEAYPINESGYHSFNPSGMVVYLMKAIQELKAEIDILKAK